MPSAGHQTAETLKSIKCFESGSGRAWSTCMLSGLSEAHFPLPFWHFLLATSSLAGVLSLTRDSTVQHQRKPIVLLPVLSPQSVGAIYGSIRW